MHARIPFLGLITGIVIGWSAKRLTGGSAPGWLAALMALVSCGVFILILFLNGFTPLGAFISTIFAVIWAYSVSEN